MRRSVGTLERDRIEIVAEESEPILSLEVREGDHVEAGQVLMRQETEVAGARIAQAERAGRRSPSSLDGARERRAQGDDRGGASARRRAHKPLPIATSGSSTRSEELVKQRLISQSQLDQARAARNASAASAREAKAALAELLNGTRVEQVDQARAALVGCRIGEARAGDHGFAARGARHSRRCRRCAALQGRRAPAARAVRSWCCSLTRRPSRACMCRSRERARVVPRVQAQIIVDGVEHPLDRLRALGASDAAFTPYFALTQRDRSRLAFLAEVEVTDPRVRELPAGVPVEVRILEAGCNHGRCEVATVAERRPRRPPR